MRRWVRERLNGVKAPENHSRLAWACEVASRMTTNQKLQEDLREAAKVLNDIWLSKEAGPAPKGETR